MNTKQIATRRDERIALYRGYRDDGDDAMNASLRLMDFDGASIADAQAARNAYGDFGLDGRRTTRRARSSK